jgi:hypothetical protein
MGVGKDRRRTLGHFRYERTGLVDAQFASQSSEVAEFRQDQGARASVLTRLFGGRACLCGSQGRIITAHSTCDLGNTLKNTLNLNEPFRAW